MAVATKHHGAIKVELICREDLLPCLETGVAVEAEAIYFASVKDNRPAYGRMCYYGVIEQICELHYNDFSIPVFGCKWVDNNNGVEYDDSGFTLVKLDKLGHKEDPYILASQAKQVFYMTDPSDKKRSVVITPKSRHDIDDYDDDVELEESPPTKVVQVEDAINDYDDDSSTYVRDDHREGLWIDDSSNEGASRKRRRKGK